MMRDDLLVVVPVFEFALLNLVEEDGYFIRMKLANVFSLLPSVSLHRFIIKYQL